MDAGCTGPDSKLQREGIDTDDYEGRANATHLSDLFADTGATGGNESKHYSDRDGVTVYVGPDGTKYRFCVI